MIFINFKTYPEATAVRALALAQTCQKVQAQSGIGMAVAVQAVDLAAVAAAVTLPVWAQHADSREPGKSTGFIPAHNLKLAGAAGVMLNHSEHPLQREELTKTVSQAKEVGLETLIFVSGPEEAEKVAALNSDYLVLEEPGLVGSGRAMVDDPAAAVKVKAFLDSGLASRLLIGAGISSGKDVAKSLALGAGGVVVSSFVVLSADPALALSKLAAGFQMSAQVRPVQKS